MKGILAMNLMVPFKVLLPLLVLSSISEVAAISDEIRYGRGSDMADHLKYCPKGSTSPLSSYRIHKAVADSYKNAWSGTRQELETIVADAEKKYGFEVSKHLGRNATMLIPATRAEMELEIKSGNLKDFKTTKWDGAHAKDADSDDWDITWAFKAFESGVVKYIDQKTGREAVYDSISGRCLTNTKLGTMNFNTDNSFWSATFGDHNKKDMAPNKTKADSGDRFSKDGDQYKYVGILYERDPNNPDKYHIIDGQTGLPMDAKQVAEFPTTLSDMWKDMGLSCVKNDAEDMVSPKEHSQPKATTVTSKTTIREGHSGQQATIEVHSEKPSNTGIASPTPMADANTQVGVRGWCNCGDDHGKRYIVGDMFCTYSKLECNLVYTLCGRCGCVVRPKDCAGTGLQILDVKLYNELKRRNGGKLAWLDAFDPLKERQSKIEAIPNGQIVVGGKCVCKEADPIKVGFTNREAGEFFVCCLCGHVREPDENGNIPNGPTNLSEMGLDELANKARERISEWLKEGNQYK